MTTALAPETTTVDWCDPTLFAGPTLAYAAECWWFEISPAVRRAALIAALTLADQPATEVKP